MNAASYYRRLLPAQAATQPGSDVETGLIDLGEKMRDFDPPEEISDKLVEAGYTYLGQFIDHDLTLDLTPLANVGTELTPNFRTPFLDLDQVYGGGPSVSPFLYDRTSRRGAERFLIGQTSAVRSRTEARVDFSAAPDIRDRSPLSSSQDDLPRNSQGSALTADARQDENLILAQLHVAFLKFHNRVLGGLAGGELQSAGPEKAPLFEQARRLVTWHYQWIVRHDFLYELLDPEVFEQLPASERVRRSHPPPNDRIPVEFSVAAFRFGHSMVRDKYHYNEMHEDADLVDDLVARTGSGEAGNVPLPADWVIPWDRFFLMPPDTSHRNRARKIDTKIANGLHNLSPKAIRLFNIDPPPSSAVGPDHPSLPVRTLLRGARMGLASGQDAAHYFAGQEPDIRILSRDEMVHGPHEKILTQPTCRFDVQTPLWYYVLKEAETLQEGRTLGPVGSRIVAHVMLDVLAADPHSYLRAAPPDWKPSFADSMSKLLASVRGGS